jgi:aryl-alcohol dehydrogenase-like predicted oxidoreductase
MTIPTTKLGATGPTVPVLALGCMGMSDVYGPADETESIATIHAALERGVSLLDTGDFYGHGHNELLIAKALRGRRDNAILSVKFGGLRSPDGAFVGFDTRPIAIKNFLGYTLKRLGVDYIDVYRPARLDATVPIEDTIGAIAEMVKAGYVRHIGLSEMGVDTIRRAAKVHPIVDLQIEYSLISRGPEAAILPALAELGIATTAYGVLSRGLLTGAKPKAGDFRAHMPRFQAPENQRLVDALARLAAAKGVKPAQLAIAWVRSRGPSIIPVLGARTRAQLDDAIAGASLALTPSELAAIEDAIPASAVVGTRYAAAQMAHLDSER